MEEINTEFLSQKSKANTYRGWILGRIAIARKDNNKEMEFVMQETLNKFNEYYPERIVKNEIRILSGWKGKGSLEVYKGFENNFILKEFIKDKDTLEVEEHIIEVKKEDLNRIIFIIRDLQINEPVKCYYIAKKLGYEWKDLWKERKDYFRIYYWPIKVIEALGIINFSGRGTITRLV